MTTRSAWRHLPGCFGCGPANECSLGVTFEAADDHVRGLVTFDERHVGPPGLAHGGAIATLLDEVMGSIPGPGDDRRVTASIAVRFRRPVALHRPLVATARIDEIDDRGYVVVAEVRYDDEPGVVRADATARFVRFTKADRDVPGGRATTRPAQ